ncbi:MAG TPA: glycoside hydrolase family 25 protein [Thermoanaerobaculia bacterium]|jgi:lysozyme|nr:glycoside hydrolase family 25 protein [Thermoanaerobaculia bacterium]
MLDTVIDVSHFNGSPDWTSVRASGVAGVIHKATQGGTWVDPTFGTARTAAPAAGLLWGAYHFGTGDEDGSVQGQFFLDTVQPDAQTLCAIDFEPNPSGTQMSLDQLAAWIETVQNATGRPPLVYGGMSLLFGEIGTSMQATLAACPLWVAQYTSAAEPSGIPAQVWNGWTLWQYTASGSVPGISGSVDRSRYQGSAAELAAWWAHGQ